MNGTAHRIALSTRTRTFALATALLAAAGACAEEPTDLAGVQAADEPVDQQVSELIVPSDGARNLARDPGTSAVAQSTYPGYAATRAIDGDRSTVVGGAHSWANAHDSAPGGRLPQRFEVDLPAVRQVEGINLYTTSGYELRDYDIEAWDGSAWQMLVQQRGNHQATVGHAVGTVLASKLRVTCLAGPSNQVVYARINELEIIGRDAGPSATSSVLQTGADWQLVHVDTTAAPGTPAIHEDLAIVRSGDGLASAPLPQAIKDELAADEPGGAYVISSWIANDLQVARDTGVISARLQAIAEPDDAPTDGNMHKSSCNDQQVTHSRSVSFNGPFSKSVNLAAGLTGTVGLSGGVQASATLDTHFTKKRTKVAFWCVTYGTRFDGADVSGSGQIQQGANLSGTLSYAHEWKWDVAEIKLGGVLFFVGPVPVYLDFRLPIEAGVGLAASATGTVQYNGAQTGTGSFHAGCSLNSGCSGGGSWNLSAPPGQPIVNGSLSARVKATPWVDVGFRVSLYHEDFVYVQAGLRPGLVGDLWAYHGNTCGDADGDGANETVNALTVDVDGELKVTAKAAFLKTVAAHEWDDLFHWTRHILFAKLIGDESALSPLLTGPAAPVAGSSQSYALRMRSCWPYDDKVSYSLAAGGVTSTTQGPAHENASVGVTFPAAGPATLTGLAIRDEHGRTLGLSSARTVNVTTGTWTSWLDRDVPDGSGDWEILSEFVAAGQACANPIAVECQTVGGVDWTQAGQVYTCTTTSGGVCVNANQPSGQTCQDYHVRFLCP
jgi:hypothetical protein